MSEEKTRGVARRGPEYVSDEEQELAPLQCPLSSTVLTHSEPWVRDVFRDLNEARLNGSQGGLDKLQARLREWLDDGKQDSSEPKGLSDKLILEAALGDCLTIIGRWDGDRLKLMDGVDFIGKFVHGIEHLDLGDQGATRVRAHAYLGNAYTRLGYVTHEPHTLRHATEELESRTLRRRVLGFRALSGAVHRDLGDAYIGQLHWNPEVPIDGAAIKTLRTAAMIFSEIYVEESAAGRKVLANRMFDEWAAAQSSLAVALSKTALELGRGAPHEEWFLEGLPVDERSSALSSEAEVIVWNIWRVYLGLLSGPGKPRWRWTRTISNLAFAGMYVFQSDTNRVACGGLAEVAFLSVMDGGHKNYKRAFEIPLERLWHGKVLRMSVRYTRDDHRHRYEVNEKGLLDLNKAVQGE